MKRKWEALLVLIVPDWAVICGLIFFMVALPFFFLIKHQSATNSINTLTFFNKIINFHTYYSFYSKNHFTNNHSKFSNTTASHYSVCFPLSKNRFSENTSNSWIFDSGASDHFCNDISLMKNLEPASAWVNTANGDMKVSKIGSVKLPGNCDKIN